MSEYYDPNFTLVFDVFQWRIFDDDRCTCYNSNGTCGDYIYKCECKITYPQRIKCTKYLVRVIGSPIRFLPHDCTYNVMIWERDCYDGEESREMFDNESPIYEFSITSTVDPVDLERPYAKILRKYITHPDVDHSDFKLYYEGFRGPCSLINYKNSFDNLVSDIISPPCSTRDQEEECPHSTRKRSTKVRRR